MTKHVLYGVEVVFPYEPYGIQKAYMAKVIECLKEEKNGILESPAGTGKTLSLLCSSLAWLQMTKTMYPVKRLCAADGTIFQSSQLESTPGHSSSFERMAPPKIIYSSRTHSQLAQAIRGYKKTIYKYMKMAVFGSRDQMCVDPELNRQTSKTMKMRICHSKVNDKNCSFYNMVDSQKRVLKLQEDIHDIEDLVQLGKEKNFCPYYMSKELGRDADIIFTPYNYLLNAKIRKANGIKLEGSILIIDEAHNIEQVCEEAESCKITSTDFSYCIKDVEEVIKTWMAGVNSFIPDYVYDLKDAFLQLKKVIDSIPLPADNHESIFPGSYMFELLEKVDISSERKPEITEQLNNLIQVLADQKTLPFHKRGAGLQKFLDLIDTVYSTTSFSSEQKDRVAKCYKVYVTAENTKKMRDRSLSRKTGRVIQYMCLNADITMQNLVDQGVKCIILTSSTLSPLSTYTSFQVPFPVQVKTPHIIGKKQLWVGAICKGPDGGLLNSSFKNRNTHQYKTSLGESLLTLSKVIPDGLLVFFPSYTVMEICIKYWKKSHVWSRLSETKTIFVEPKENNEFLTEIKAYYEQIYNPAFNGACFMGVCRGKVSEGIGFPDRDGRAVVITGVPYPAISDPKVKLKRKHLDETSDNYKNGLNGREWYSLQASKVVNQAIGRIIRHKNDYGAIIFCDEQFAQSSIHSNLSPWILPYPIYEKFDPVIEDITQFFNEALISLPQPKHDDLRRAGALGSQVENLRGAGTFARYLEDLRRAEAFTSQVEESTPSTSQVHHLIDF